MLKARYGCMVAIPRRGWFVCIARYISV
jgi:hypothetical protein